jgi:hypothetical protein
MIVVQRMPVMRLDLIMDTELQTPLLEPFWRTIVQLPNVTICLRMDVLEYNASPTMNFDTTENSLEMGFMTTHNNGTESEHSLQLITLL